MSHSRCLSTLYRRIFLFCFAFFVFVFCERCLLLLLENCPVGTFFDIKERNCVACPQDTYNPVTGQVGLCRVCPQGTFTVNNGSKNISQCLGMAFINWIVFDIKQRLIVRNCTPIKHLMVCFTTSAFCNCKKPFSCKSCF